MEAGLGQIGTKARGFLTRKLLKVCVLSLALTALLSPAPPRARVVELGPIQHDGLNKPLQPQPSPAHSPNPLDLLPAIEPPPDGWPQLQHDPQRTGYTSEVINPPFETVIWRWNVDQNTVVKIAPMVQPIVADSKVFIGDLEGKMNVLDMNTGERLWSYQAEKGIFHTVAYDDAKVYFTSDDSYIYCVDTVTGDIVWKYKTGAGIWTAPLVVNNVVYVASRDKTLYALDANLGTLNWSYKTGGPILNSPAYSSTQDAVLFGSDDMYVYSLSAKSGALNWRTRVEGQSFRDYWPVVSDKHGLVIVRTMPVLPFQWSLGETGTFFVLDLATGQVQDGYTNLVKYTSGVGGPPEPPVIDKTDDNMYVVISGSYMSGGTVGRISLTTGSVTWSSTLGGGDLPAYVRLVGDEGRSLSLSGNNLLLSTSQSVGGINVTTEELFHIVHELEAPRDGYTYVTNLAIFHEPEIAIYSSESPGGHAAPPWGPAAVSNGMIFWISDGSGVVAVDSN